MEVIVRPYRSEDRDALVALWRTCGLVRPVNDPGRDIDRSLAHDAAQLLVLQRDGHLVGSVMVGYDGHRGWLNYVAVAPEHQREGLGRMLVSEAERHLCALGCAKVNLQIRASNALVVDFYRRLGYILDDVISMGKRIVVDEEDRSR